MYPRCKSLGLIEARFEERGSRWRRRRIRGVKASASLKHVEPSSVVGKRGREYPRCKSLGLIEAVGSQDDTVRIG